MGSLLHLLRNRSRRLTGALAMVFALSSFFAMTPSSAYAMDMHPQHSHAVMPMDSMTHHCCHTQPAEPMPQHHTAHACCLGAMNCAHAYDHSLVELRALADISGTSTAPLDHNSSVAVTRPIQPPRRPPKG